MKNLKKILALVLVLALSVCVFSACGDTKTDTADKKDDTTTAVTTAKPDDKDDSVLVMGTNAQFPPYEMIGDDGNFTGIDVEIMTAVAEKLGKTLKVEDMDFDAIIPAVQSGKVDCGVAGMSVNDERKKSVDFTVSYTTAYNVVIVKNDSAIVSPEDLSGKKVGVQTGTTGDALVSEEKDVTVERYKTGFEAVQSLIQGKVDAVVIDNEPAKVFAAQNEGIKILEKEYAIEEYAIAIAKDNGDLLKDINTAIQTLLDDGTIDTIIAKYIKA